MCKLISSSCMVGLLALSCSNSFDSRGPLQQQLVVYSVLSTDRNEQFVQVQGDYMPQTYNPLSSTADNSITGANVVLSVGGKTYTLRDTLLSRVDTSRYKFPIHAYYIGRLPIQRGKDILVSVSTSSYGAVSSSTIVPDQPKITLDPRTGAILDQPNKNPLDAPMIFYIQLSKVAKGYIARLLLYYDVLKGSEWVEEALEVPVTSNDSAAYTLDMPRYPQMNAASTSGQIAITYKNGYYRGILNKKNFEYRSTELIFKWATLVVLQADENLFRYYLNVHPNDDPRSVRLDEPMVTTINGGLGMVGSYSLDSLVYLLPYDFWGNR